MDPNDPQLQLMMMQMAMLAQQGGASREHPLSRAFAGTPMYGGTPLQFAPMFNIPGLQSNTPMGMIAGMMLQGILPAMMGPNFIPGQFTPTQNFFDYRYAMNYFMQQRRAIEIAAQADAETYFRILRGMSRMRGVDFMEGTPQEREAGRFASELEASNYRFARDLTALTPILGYMFPELIDQISGIRGSAVLMAQRMTEAGRYQFDPVTGRLGMSGESAGVITGEVFRQLYGSGANLVRMRGLGAGRAGQIYEELSRRGFGAPAFLDENEARAQLLRELAKRPDQIRSEDLRNLSLKLRGDTGIGDTDNVSAAYDRLSRAINNMEQPALDAALRSFNATRVAQTIERYAGAVSAMRDIFGDMGRPNAPIVEIFNGLQALTQGGLSRMTPAQIEQSVRETYAIAKYTGLGLEGIMGFAGTAGQILDQRGLSRAFAPQIAQGSALFGFAYGVAGQAIGFGSMDREMATQIDTLLRINAITSAQAGRLGGFMRVAAQYRFDPNRNAYRLQKAIERGDKEFEYINPKTGERSRRSITMSLEDIENIMVDAGVNPNFAAQMSLADPRAQQEYILRYGIHDLLREEQGRLDVEPIISNAAASSVVLGLKGFKLGDKLIDEYSMKLSQAISHEMFNLYYDNRSFFDAGREWDRNKEIARRLMSNRELNPLLRNMTQERTAEIIGMHAAAVDAFINRPNSPYSRFENIRGLLGAFDRRTFELASRAKQETQAVAEVQRVLSSIGQAGLAQRISDYLQDVGPDGGNVYDFIYRSLGAIPVPEVRRAGMALMNRLEQLTGQYGAARTKEEKDRILADMKALAPAIEQIINHGNLDGISDDIRSMINAYGTSMTPQGAASIIGASSISGFGGMLGIAGAAAASTNPRAAFGRAVQNYTEIINRELSNRNDIKAARENVEKARRRLQAAEEAHRRSDASPEAYNRLRDARKALTEAQDKLNNIESEAIKVITNTPEARQALEQLESARSALNAQYKHYGLREVDLPSLARMRLAEAHFQLWPVREAALGQMNSVKQANKAVEDAQKELEDAQRSGNADAIRESRRILENKKRELEQARKEAIKRLDDNPNLDEEYTKRRLEYERLRRMTEVTTGTLSGLPGASPGTPVTFHDTHEVVIHARSVRLERENVGLVQFRQQDDHSADMVRAATGATGHQVITGTLTIEGLDRAILTAHSAVPSGLRGGAVV